MFFSTVLTTLAFTSATGWAQYVLEDDFMNGDFFDNFSFFNSSDPTHGYVDYVEQDYANAAGLINTNGGQVYMGVDHDSTTGSSGRPSVRITSNKSYNSGLVILDLAHMPAGCGTWPAFWMVGPNWPNQGEIDIIEGVNDQSTNDMTLHTGAGCSITSNSDMLGSISTPNCDVQAEGQSANAGCQITTQDTQTFGTGFNDNQGGVYATQWTDDAISVFFFPRSSIPSDIDSGSPDPSSWGKPHAKFSGDCDIAKTFSELQIVFDITFCGDWAGNTWSSSETCSAKADTCTDFVQNNPSAFEDAYWTINSLKVYQDNGAYSSKVVGSGSTGSSASVSASISASISSSVSSAQPANTTSSAFIPPIKSSLVVTSATGFPLPSANATTSGFATGSGIVASTGFAIPVASSGFAVPSSPPKPVAQSATISSASAAAETQSAETHKPWSWHADGGEWKYGPAAHEKRHAKHLRAHKRHAAGRF